MWRSEERKMYKVLVGKPKKEAARKTEMDPMAIGWKGGGNVSAVDVPLAGCCEHGDEPSGSGATELVTYGMASI
jgi:hypothetical protein